MLLLVVALALVTAPAAAAVQSISGQVFDDFNGNGVKDAGEPGHTAAPATVQFDLTPFVPPVDFSAATDATGNYSKDLLPGLWRVRLVPPAGTFQTSPNPTDQLLALLTPVAGIDFGLGQLASITGQAFVDGDRDGVKDVGEVGLPGVGIQLDKGADGSVDQTAITGPVGDYGFVNLDPATYRVRMVLPPGASQTTANPADVLAVYFLNRSGLDFGVSPPSASSGNDNQNQTSAGQLSKGAASARLLNSVIFVGRDRIARLRLRCAAQGTSKCVGSALLQARLPNLARLFRNSAARKLRRLGRKAFAIGAGKSGAAKVRLSKKVYRLLKLKRSLKARATVTVRQPGGAAAAKLVRSVKLKPKRRHARR
jgi:SdrD B-like protein